MAASGREHRHSICRILLPPDRLRHFQVDLSASNSVRADGVWRFGLADLSVASARRLPVPLQSGPRHPRRRIADPVAPRGRRERSRVEGAGQHRSGPRMKAAIYSRYGPLHVVQITEVEKPVPKDDEFRSEERRVGKKCSYEMAMP